MNVTPVDNTNGILLLKQGKIFKQEDTFNLVCSYNISYLRSTTLRLESLFASAKVAGAEYVPGSLHKSYSDQIEHKLNIIYNKLTFLVPHGRNKRGLINGLGSLVKTITGNLDYEDAVRMEKQISNLNSKIHNVQEKSVILAQKTLSEFGNQLNKINENQNKLSSLLKNITMHSNSVFRQFNFLEIHIQIDFSLQIILDKLMILEDAMTFAQIGTMHPSIINAHNLISEMIDMKRKFDFIPVATISVENIHKIEKSIEVKAYSTEHTLNFILYIPSVEPIPYDLIHIYSIPDQRNLTIIPKSKYLVLGKGEYAYIDEACRVITESIHLCNQLEMRPLQDTGDCITALIQHRADPTSCTYAKMNLKAGKLQNITPNSWLLIINSQQVLKSTCGDQVGYHTLTKTQLIAISYECRIQVLNRTLQTHSTTLPIHDVIPLPTQRTLPTDEIRFELQLEDTSLDNIQGIINKAESIQDETEYEDWTFVATTPSWTTIILYIIGAAILTWKMYRFFSRRKLEKQMESSSTAAPEQTNTTSGGPDRTDRIRFSLKGGGITMS